VEKNIAGYFSVCFNPKVGNSMGLSSQQLKGISKDFEKLNIKKLEGKGKWSILGWVLLKGKKGEMAYLDEDSLSPQYPRKDPKIMFEFPLSVTVDEIRFFTENAIRIFKDKFEQDSEMSFDGSFRRITKRPYKEYFSSILNTKIRSRSYADKKPHGTNSKRPEYKKKRDEWICKQYKSFQKRRLFADIRYGEIQEKLNQLPLNSFGEWPDKKRDPKTGQWKAVKKSPLELSFETIKDIVQRKS